MRGSPLFRTLLVLAVLALTGLGLAKLTGVTAPKPAPSHATPPPSATEATRIAAHYRLQLSAAASALELSVGEQIYREQEGTFRYDPDQPAVFLKITWKESGEAHRFAKLTVEIPGKPTQSHVFEAPGDLDDVWEIQP